MGLTIGRALPDVDIHVGCVVSHNCALELGQITKHVSRCETDHPVLTCAYPPAGSNDRHESRSHNVTSDLAPPAVELFRLVPSV
jgi:hypothetical protein